MWPNLVSLISACASKNQDFLGFLWNLYGIGCPIGAVDEDAMVNATFTKKKEYQNLDKKMDQAE